MYYIVEYEKGTEQRCRVRDAAGCIRKYQIKKDALLLANEMQKQTDKYLYKVWSTTQCPDGDCLICMDLRCPVKSDYEEEGGLWEY